MRNVILLVSSILIGLLAKATWAGELAIGPVYSVIELRFEGPRFGPADSPARDVEFWVRVQHHSGSPTYKIHGFWDGDGAGGSRGNSFKIRLSPTKQGRWTLVEVYSNRLELLNQKIGDYVTATPSALPGFWIADRASPDKRWYRRSDGSHQYIIGNTHYSFLSERNSTGATGGNIVTDIRGNAAYFKKLRFSVLGDRYPHPRDKPFFDDAGRPTDDGRYSHRPNPQWFRQRVDLAVRTAFDHDLIADLILCGPDTPQARATLQAAANGGKAAPWLSYIAARYGAYPNVWLCLCNEWDHPIKTPAYSAAQVTRLGQTMKSFLAYPTPLSIHGDAGNWNTKLNTRPAWHDHVIVQGKLKDLSATADFIHTNFGRGGGDKPTLDDELAYQGAGDGWTEGDTIESHLGAFMGGGYGTTGYKPGSKVGQYFWGKFNATAHSAADNLLWMRTIINAHISFWRLRPVGIALSIFPNASREFRALQWSGEEYVLGTDAAQQGINAKLPAGIWTVKRFDIIAKTETTLTREARGTYTFSAPASRAVLFFFKKIAGG